MFLIRKRRPWALPAWEITPESVYLSRRRFLQATGLGALALPAHGALGQESAPVPTLQYRPAAKTDRVRGFYTEETLTPFYDATHYNNFYEFGLGKRDPSRYAGNFHVRPWSVKITGEVERPGEYILEDILAPQALEERIYRLRCVEAWSMVIPWVGFPLAALLKHFGVRSQARYVGFTTLYDPEAMPGQRARFGSLRWPYVEGLRIDEAMHPLSFIAVGMYGRSLPGQNGAPLRLVVPWKYGFKSIKSIVEIRLLRRRPPTSWNIATPREYGFYANVNPEVSHPRWSQAWERRLPSGSLFRSNRIRTRLFNGYAEQVAHLYKGMDLRRNY